MIPPLQAIPSQKDSTAEHGRSQNDQTAKHRRERELGSTERSSGASRGRRAGGAAACAGCSGLTGSSRSSAAALSTHILRASARETNTWSGALGKVLLGLLRHRRKTVTAHEPCSGLARAIRRGQVGLVTTVSTRRLSTSKSVLESAEIWELGDAGVAADFYEAEFLLGGVAFLSVFVNESARINIGHLVRVESGNFLEFAVGLGAAVFGEARMELAGLLWERKHL